MDRNKNLVGEIIEVIIQVHGNERVIDLNLIEDFRRSRDQP